MVGSQGDVPADLESPGDDRFTEIGRRWTELRSRNREDRLQRFARPEVRRDRRLQEGIREKSLPLVSTHRSV